MPRKGQKIKPGSLKGGKSQPATNAKAGIGKRFQAMQNKLKKDGARDPGALAAAIGRAKYGSKKMGKMASKGRKRK